MIIDFGRAAVCDTAENNDERDLARWYAGRYGERFELGKHPFCFPNNPYMRGFLANHDCNILRQDIRWALWPRLAVPRISAMRVALDAFDSIYSEAKCQN